MEFSWIDTACFIGFIALVIVVSLYASRKEEGSEDYFLAGRRLTWWLIGFSLIASNISTEHFVGMSGAGYGRDGLAVASYEWIAAVCLVVVALVLLPLYLRLGIYTMPEFLEHRFGPMPRTIMAIYLMVAYVAIVVAAVLYTGALNLYTIFDLNMYAGIWLIGGLAAAYTIYGGLKAVVWSDLLQGAALLAGGTLVACLAFAKLDSIPEFFERNAERTHMVLPAGHRGIPWTALCLGIFIPNIFYWGFNQFITQRTLGARSLAEGQKGILFAAFIKLLIPFIIVFPGIIAYDLYRADIDSGDQAYAVLVQNVRPMGLRGIFSAALFGAIMSSLDSMLNSASTIFTMDIWKRRLRPDATQEDLVRVGRYATLALAVIGCLLAPLPGKFEGVFDYIQKIWGFISPPIVCVFIFGLLFRRAPTIAAVAALLVGVPLYGVLLELLPDMAFLNVMAISFSVCWGLMAAITLWKPLPEPAELTSRVSIELTPARGAVVMGLVICLLTVGLYIWFW